MSKRTVVNERRALLKRFMNLHFADDVAHSTFRRPKVAAVSPTNSWRRVARITQVHYVRELYVCPRGTRMHAAELDVRREIYK